jgi:hypothetical protein
MARRTPAGEVEIFTPVFAAFFSAPRSAEKRGGNIGQADKNRGIVPRLTLVVLAKPA